MGVTSRPKGQEIYRERNIQISSDGENQYEGGGDREGVEKVFDPHQLNHLSQRIGNMIKMAKSELASRKLVSEKVRHEASLFCWRATSMLLQNQSQVTIDRANICFVKAEK